MKLTNRAVVLIVDPQVDFISGSLAVPDGAAAMDWLADFLLEEQDKIERIVITMDQHPVDHCSFVDQGGQWPPHCIRYTEGASIWPKLHQAIKKVHQNGILIDYLEKATSRDHDEYSAFSTNIPKALKEAKQIFVAGIAGDYCVRQSIKDLSAHGLGDKIVRLEKGIAYIDRNAKEE